MIANVSGKVFLFSVCSISMIIVNRACALEFPYVCILLLLQNLVSALVLLVKNRTFDVSVAMSWLPCTLLFCCNLISSLQSLVFINVPTFTVLRNTQPLLSVLLGALFMQHGTQADSVFYLASMLLGALVYCSDDLFFNALGYVWALLHITSMTCYTILIKSKFSSMKITVDEMAFYNNLLSLPFLFLLSILQMMYSQETVFRDIVACTNRFQCIGTITLSCTCGVLMSVAGFHCQKVVSATTFLCLNNFSKIPAVVLSCYLFNENISSKSAHGMIISIISAFFYAYSTKESSPPLMAMIQTLLIVSCLVYTLPTANSFIDSIISNTRP